MDRYEVITPPLEREPTKVFGACDWYSPSTSPNSHGGLDYWMCNKYIDQNYDEFPCGTSIRVCISRVAIRGAIKEDTVPTVLFGSMELALRVAEFDRCSPIWWWVEIEEPTS